MKIIDKIVEVIAAMSLALSVIMICANVFYRYAVSGWLRDLGGHIESVTPFVDFLEDSFAPIGAVSGEVPGYLLIWISFFGAYLVQRSSQGHIRFDMFFNGLSLHTQKIIGYVVDSSLVGFFAILFFQSLRMIWVDGATEIETADVAQGWFMLVLPICAVLLVSAIVVKNRS